VSVRQRSQSLAVSQFHCRGWAAASTARCKLSARSTAEPARTMWPRTSPISTCQVALRLPLVGARSGRCGREGVRHRAAGNSSFRSSPVAPTARVTLKRERKQDRRVPGRVGRPLVRTTVTSLPLRHDQRVAPESASCCRTHPGDVRREERTSQSWRGGVSQLPKEKPVVPRDG